MTSAVTAYEILKSLHVLGAVVWVGGAVALNVLGARVLRGHDETRHGLFARDVEWLGNRLFVPASVVLIVTGVWAALDADIGFDTPWIAIGLAVWLASFVAGAAFVGPTLGKMAKDYLGGDVRRGRARLDKVLLVARVELLLLLLVVVVMVVKPD